MADIRTWLEGLGLGEYAQAFEAERIDLDDLARLDAADLKEMGLPIGPRKRVLEAIGALTAASKEAADAGAAAPSSAAQPDSERRQLTVLFCDLVGYTELTSRLDPEVLQGIVRSYEDTCAACVTRYEGYVFQRLGDGIVAFFGYPLAHEGEAERAIRAGLEILDTLAKLDVPDAGRLAVRIGIATGLVVVSSAEKGAVGETMNLAARLQAIAPPGSIVVSERVHRLAGGAFDYEDLGEQTLKGIAKPAHAYRTRGLSEVASRFEAASGLGLTPLVGREQELGLLMERWQLAQDGEGQVVLLSGEPGIGKSRILNTLRERLQAQGAQALRFQCSPYYVNSALWPSIDNFERALKFAHDETSESKLDKLEALIVGHYGRLRSDVRFVASMLSIPSEERYGASTMTPQKFKDETLRTLVDLTEAAARKQPSVMLFEDAHWADPTTLEVLDLLIDRVRNVPLLMVLTHRPEFQSRWSQYGHVAAVNLSKLTRAQSAAMVSRVAGGKALPGDLLEQILTKTDGVPLFVEELTKSILESGDLKETAERYEYAGSAHSIAIPATLRDSLMARLDRYAPVKEVAQIGAAIGREFSYELISAVTPMTPTQLHSALAQLVDSGLAFRRGTPPEATYTFKHALIQDAAYDSLLKSRRQELHGKIARTIEEHFPEIKETEPELLAHHLSAAGAIEAALPLWQKAGELAIHRMALSEAISHLNRGLALVSILPQSRERDVAELGLLTPLGAAWVALKGWAAPEVWTSASRALALAKSLGRDRELVPLYWWIQSNVMCQGRVAESLEWAKEMLAAAKSTGNLDLLVTGHAIMVNAYFWLGRLLECQMHAHEVFALYDEERHRHLADIVNHDPKTVAAIYAAHATWMLGYPDRARELSDAKDAHARRRGHAFDLCFALTFGSGVFDYRCEPSEHRQRFDEADRLAREQSLQFMFACMVPWQGGIALIRQGSISDGVAALNAGFSIWQAGGGQVCNPYSNAALAEAMALSGDVEGALQLVDKAIEQIERPGWEERLHYAEILRLKGWMLSLKGDLVGAEKSYRASLDWARTQQAKSWELRTSTSLARLWQAQGKRKEALALLKPVYDWFTEGFDTKDLREAKSVLEDLSA